MQYTITAEQARLYMLRHCKLETYTSGPSTSKSILDVLRHLRCVQIDPLDTVGTNAELVFLARLDGIQRHDIQAQLYPSEAFEHFAKERCILPASAFPYYREQALQTPWWRLAQRKKRISPETMHSVLEEIQRSGPITARDLEERGAVEALDWSGWKSTRRASKMALEILWTQCKVVVAGHTSSGKLFDVPSRALPHVHTQPTTDSFARWGVLQRVEAAGLLPRSVGPWWSMLESARKDNTIPDLLAERKILEVTIEGSCRSYLAPRSFLEFESASIEYDENMRIIGPLDPIIWDRKRTEHIFGFEYIWEVYKPAPKRRWGWYVCPLLHQGRFVGRFEGHYKSGEIQVKQLWKEEGTPFSEQAWKAAIERHTHCLHKPSQTT